MKADRAYLEHILNCIQRIRKDSSPARAAVLESQTLQDAIVRNLQVLCESARRLSESCRQRHPEIDWRGIAATRNVLVHDYLAVDF